MLYDNFIYEVVSEAKDQLSVKVDNIVWKKVELQVANITLEVELMICEGLDEEIYDGLDE